MPIELIDIKNDGTHLAFRLTGTPSELQQLKKLFDRDEHFQTDLAILFSSTELTVTTDFKQSFPPAVPMEGSNISSEAAINEFLNILDEYSKPVRLPLTAQAYTEAQDDGFVPVVRIAESKPGSLGAQNLQPMLDHIAGRLHDLNRDWQIFWPDELTPPQDRIEILPSADTPPISRHRAQARAESIVEQIQNAGLGIAQSRYLGIS